VENRKAKQVLSRVVRTVKGRIQGKDAGGWIWWKYYVHMYVNGKMRIVETGPGMGEKE
jgi:hypothetical protein